MVRWHWYCFNSMLVFMKLGMCSDCTDPRCLSQSRLRVSKAASNAQLDIVMLVAHNKAYFEFDGPVKLTSLCTLMNSCGSPLAHGGKTTSSNVVPSCMQPILSYTHLMTNWTDHLQKNIYLNTKIVVLILIYITKVKLVGVDKKVWEVEKFWNELSDITHVVLRCRFPLVLNAVKHPLWNVKCSAL